MTNQIPIIEPNKEKGGYWELYNDGRKIWHDEKGLVNKMSKFKDYEKTGKKYNIGSGGYMKLKEGDNRVRLLTIFEDYGSHYIRKQNKSYICIGKDNHCWFCEKGLVPRVRYIGYVIDRVDGQIKLLQIGWKIYSQIGKYSKDPEYKFDVIPEYDININRVGVDKNTEYTVIPARKNKPLTEKEMELITEKIKKSPTEIVEERKVRMTAKTKGEDSAGSESEEEEVNVDDIPF